MKNITVLSQGYVLAPDVHIFTGRKKLQLDDLQGVVNVDKMPPDAVASLGSKMTIDPKEIDEFETDKKAIERICLKKGTRFLRGFFVTEEHIEEVAKDVQEIVDRFNARASLFVSRYMDIVDDWARQHPAWAEMIKRAATPKEAVQGRLYASFNIFRVEPASPDADSPLNAGLISSTNSMADQIYKEIGVVANQVWEKTFQGKDKVTSRVKKSFINIRDKFVALRLIDSSIDHMVAHIDGVLAQMPKEGHITGHEFSQLVSLLIMLSKPARAREFATAMASGAPEREKTAEAVAPVITEEEVQEEADTVEPPPVVQSTVQSSYWI